MIMRRTPRGQPLVALLLLLGCWIGFRIMFRDLAAFAPVSAAIRISAEPAPVRALVKVLEAGSVRGGESVTGGGPARAPTVVASRWPAMSRLPALPPANALPRHDALSAGVSLSLPSVPALVRGAAVQQTLWMLMARTPSASGMEPSRTAGRAVPDVTAEPQRPARTRWSSDSWLLLRRGGNVSLASGPAPATYGASQAGAVLRYRLAPGGRHRPSAYVRATAALNGSGEREAALGLSVRPLARLPVTVAAEVRAAVWLGDTRLRPAVTAYTELPPIALPRRLRGEAYAQAGYVGGRYATPFVDGQLRVDRKLETIGRGELRAGVGAWGGAQKGASRLDLGPAAMVGVGLGGVGLGESASARLAFDWRFRIAGNAEPTSGPALTLSAGF